MHGCQPFLPTMLPQKREFADKAIGNMAEWPLGEPVGEAAKYNVKWFSRVRCARAGLRLHVKR